jgi:hypothetical protein
VKTRLINLAVFVGVSLICLVALEVIGRTVLLRDKLYLVNDVDHRLDPEWDGVNDDGLRENREAADISPDAFNIVMLGDSYVMGLGLTVDRAPAAALEAELRRRRPDLDVNVLNFGWTSSSPLLSHRQLRDIGHRYHPDLVLECVDMTDMHDDIKYRRLLDRDGVYRVLHAVPMSFLLLRRGMSNVRAVDGLHERIFGFPSRRYFASTAPLSETRHHFTAIRGNLDALSETARELFGAGFAVAVFPRNFQYSDRESPESWEAGEYEPLGPYAIEPFRYFEAMAREVDYPVWSLLDDFLTADIFPTCFVDDPHWNENGVAVVAGGLARRLEASGLLPPPPAE